MDSIILIFVCLFAGAALQRVPAVPANAHTVLNQFVIYISLPALSLYYIPKVVVSSQLLYPIAVGWIGFFLAWAIFAGLGRVLNWPKKLTGCLVLTAGFSNTSFIGFPVIQALYGQSGLKTAIIVDQPGTFVVVSTLGVLVAIAYSNGASGGGAILRKILLFPPFIAFVAALAMNGLKFDFINTIQLMLQKLGGTVTPVALVAVGLQLRVQRHSSYWGYLGLGLLVKLLVVPAFFILLYIYILGAAGEAVDVSIMESAMAPMITAALLASTYNLKPRLAGMMVGIGIPVSFITLAFWYFILKL